MAKTINDEFMMQVATEQAWKKLAEEYAWTEDLLEKYADKLDWKKISSNGAIRWTVPMLRKFSSKLDWKELSENINDEWFTEAHLEAFKEVSTRCHSMKSTRNTSQCRRCISRTYGTKSWNNAASNFLPRFYLSSIKK